VERCPDGLFTEHQTLKVGEVRVEQPEGVKYLAEPVVTPNPSLQPPHFISGDSVLLSAERIRQA
jgi:hypothetical protein